MKHKNCYGKKMSFPNALKLVVSGKKITRGTWLLNDYLYLDKGRLFNDGSYSHLELIRTCDLKNDWYEYKEVVK